MSWVKLDDGFFRHRKVIALGKDAKLLYLAGLAHSADQLTDGVLTEADVRLAAATAGVKAAARRELVDAGLWHELGHDCESEHCPHPPAKAIIIHDYLRYQPTGADERRRRALARERTERWRKGRRRDTERDADGDASRMPSPYSSPYSSPRDSYPSPQPPVEESPAAGGNERNGNTLAAQVAQACSGRDRQLVNAEAALVVDHLTRYVDRRLVEEAATAAHDRGANLPRWLLPVVRSNAQGFGIAIPPHPTLERNR